MKGPAQKSAWLIVFTILMLLAGACQSFCKVHGRDTSNTIVIRLSGFTKTPQSVAFKEVHDTESIPSSVIREFDRGIANPGARFQLGDVIYDKTLPYRRLIFAGISDRYCILSYERGGIGLSRLFTIFEYSSDTAKVVFITSRSVLNLAQAKALLESGQTKNDPQTIL